MAFAQPKTVSPMTLLGLGRVSNLPTVWTDVLAGTVLAGGSLSWQFAVVVLAMTLFYVGGMYLNDYYDRAIDARERRERPIPAGKISAQAVGTIGFGLLTAGAVLMSATGLLAAAFGIALAVAIVFYDARHKGNPLAPVVMGACRALVYCGAAAATTGAVPAWLVLASLALAAYVAGLTYAARQESLDRVGNLWPLAVLSAPMLLAAPALAQGPEGIAVYLALIAVTAYAIYLLARRPMAGAVSRAVAVLIAAISLVDAALLASVGAVWPALVAVAGFFATMLWQRSIAGT